MAAKRPVMWVALGLRERYTNVARAGGVVPFVEIREIDPTPPGHDYADDLRGDYKEGDNGPRSTPPGRHLRLIKKP